MEARPDSKKLLNFRSAGQGHVRRHSSDSMPGNDLDAGVCAGWCRGGIAPTQPPHPRRRGFLSIATGTDQRRLRSWPTGACQSFLATSICQSFFCPRRFESPKGVLCGETKLASQRRPLLVLASSSWQLFAPCVPGTPWRCRYFVRQAAPKPIPDRFRDPRGDLGQVGTSAILAVDEGSRANEIAHESRTETGRDGVRRDLRATD